MSLKQASLAYVYAAFTIIFWSTAATAFKLSLAHIDFLLLVFYASSVSLLMLGSLCIATGQIKQLRAWRLKDYKQSAFLGALNPFLYYLLLFKAYELLPAQEAQVINFFWPIVLVILGAIFLQQKINFFSAIAIFISFIGVVIVATHGEILSLNFSNTLGVTLAFISTIIWATYWVVNQAQKSAPLLRLFVNFAAGFIWLALLLYFTDRWAWPNSQAWIGAIYIGLFEMSLAFFCWFKALRLAKNVSIMSNLVFLTPFFSLLVIAKVLNEPIYASTIVGLALICISIFVQRWAARSL